MPVLLPFRAFRSAPLTLHIPGEDPARSFSRGSLIADSRPALFIYRQRFLVPGELDFSSRTGIMGLLDRTEAKIFPHEQTVAKGVEASRARLQSADSDPGSLWLWCGDDAGLVAPLLAADTPPEIHATDRFGCLHEIWPVAKPARIQQIQSGLEGQELFIADGHHRFAAGWNLATIQVRNDALRTLPSHRLLNDVRDLHLPEGEAISESMIADYLATGSGLVVVTPGPIFKAVKMPPNWLATAGTYSVREIPSAIAAVQSGEAQIAILTAPVSIGEIETDARKGLLRAPKSTDFFPKLAAGLVIHRNSE